MPERLTDRQRRLFEQLRATNSCKPTQAEPSASERMRRAPSMSRKAAWLDQFSGVRFAVTLLNNVLDLFVGALS